ncbi:hypothetical protein [Nocardioides immobilis]|uniref:hypothetical protein n=1 Tax=Nocardioides immobilis TaxID=2049295 RepID=UPI0015FBC3C5|nr:hypothetical protein [Nocardioides immobilis]
MVWIAVTCLALGTVGIVRGAIIVAVGSAGRFRGDAAASLIVGFALALTGQLLLVAAV